MIKLIIKSNTVPKKTYEYFKNLDNGINRGLMAGGLQLINNMVNGSPGSSAVPPKDTGHLRGSASAFVGKEFVGDTQGLEREGTPNKSYSGPGNNTTITVGFDTPYAALMNENIGGKFNLGQVSLQSGNVEMHFVQKHIEGDAKEVLQLITDIAKKDSGG